MAKKKIKPYLINNNLLKIQDKLRSIENQLNESYKQQFIFNKTDIKNFKLVIGFIQETINNIRELLSKVKTIKNDLKDII